MNIHQESKILLWNDLTLIYLLAAQLNPDNDTELIRSKLVEITLGCGLRRLEQCCEVKWQREESELCSTCCCCSVTKSYPTLCNPWSATCQASLSFTISQSLLRFMSTELVMLSNHLIFLCPLLLLTSVFPSIRVLSTTSPQKWDY